MTKIVFYANLFKQGLTYWLLIFFPPGIGQTGLWLKQTESANHPAIGLSGRTFQLSAHQQDVSSEPSTLRERVYPAQHRLTRTNGRLTINLCHCITTLTRADVTSGASWASPLQRPWELRTWGTWPASLRHNWSSTLEKRQGDEMSQLFIFAFILLCQNVLGLSDYRVSFLRTNLMQPVAVRPVPGHRIWSGEAQTAAKVHRMQ